MGFASVALFCMPDIQQPQLHDREIGVRFSARTYICLLSISIQIVTGLTQLHGYRGYLAGVKWPGREAITHPT